MNASEIKTLAEQLGNFFFPRGTGRQWAAGGSFARALAPPPEPHGWHGGVGSELEILEAADEIRLSALGLANAPRLRRNDTFIVSYHPVPESIEDSAGLEWPLRSPREEEQRRARTASRFRFCLDRVLAIDAHGSLEGSRALLAGGGEHVGRVVEFTSSLSPLYWQPHGVGVRRTIVRHVGSWFETDGPDDLVLPAYRCALFSAKE